MDKLLTLEEWAKANYASPPSQGTLWRWAREARIYPAPEKQGRAYYVRPDARYIDPSKPLPRPPAPAAGRAQRRSPTSIQLVERIGNGKAS
ncbi:excisionase [Azospirillum melinis]|uniref:excisionase n=1 Tax=Azospirillum melinis TaxID=328839 RepID=UPI003757D164